MIELWHSFGNDVLSCYIIVTIMVEGALNITFVVTGSQLRMKRCIFRVINKAKYPLIHGKEYSKPDQLYKNLN